MATTTRTPPARSQSRGAPAGKGAASRRSAPTRRRPSRTPPARPVKARVAVAGGVLWAALLCGAVLLSGFTTFIALAAVAVVATVSGLRAGGRQPSALLLGAGVAAAVVAPLAALAGPVPGMAGLVILGGVVLVLAAGSAYASSARPLHDLATSVVAGAAPAVAATCVVAARHQGTTLALALVAASMAYDSGAFLMGHGRSAFGGVIGVAFGVASVAVVAVFVAAAMQPPFTGARPWVVFAVVAALCPLGVRLAGSVAGGQRLPAVRRLDSLYLAAPAWALLVALVLHR